MAHAGALQDRKRARALVRLQRGAFDETWMNGYVVDVGTRLFAFEIVTPGVRFDGMACMRNADVSLLENEPHAAFFERALAARGCIRASAAPVDLQSMRGVIETAGRAFPVIALHVPAEENKYDCFIGKVVAVNEDTVDFHHITPDGEWEDGLLEIPFLEVVRVDFGGDYEEALLLAAGRPTSV